MPKRSLSIVRRAGRRLGGWSRAPLAVVVVAALLCLAAANVAELWTWDEVEDGVLWVARPEGVMAADVWHGSAAERAGIRVGDVLLGIDGRPVESPDDVVDRQHESEPGTRLVYAVLSLGSQELREVTLQPVPAGNRTLYFVLVGVAVFTLFVGASVRLRRPNAQATLHFFWLTVAFFGVFAFSFSGRLDSLDWVVYWADVVAILLLPPLFIHFALIFPDRASAWTPSRFRPFMLPLVYLPALLLGGLRATVLVDSGISGPGVTTTVETVERLELAYLAICIIGGVAIMIRALRRVRSVTARRQLRWIVWGTLLGGLPFLGGYLVPYILGYDPPPQMELTAIPLGFIPLAFASAVVRYRLMDVEVIIKRALVYTAAILAIVAIYGVLLRFASDILLGGSQQHNSIIALLATLVVVLLASPVKNAIQAALDRAYYRDRYDYRRALVGFARDLNRDLDIRRLSERLVTRVMETFVVDRMALLLAPPEGGADADFHAIHAVGFDETLPVLARQSVMGERLLASRTVVLDDLARRVGGAEVEAWRALSVHYFVPSVSKDGTIAVLALSRKESGEPLSSEDMALLATVAAQVATALENGRLYSQLHGKAAELDRLREFSENVIESLIDGLAVVDLDDRVVRWNRGLERLYGVPRTVALGQRVDALFDPSFVQMVREAHHCDAAAGAVRHRVPLVSRHAAGGRRLRVDAATTPLRTPGGGIEGTIVVVEDITSRVQLEEQLQISEKMASIGLLAAGVAHEVNTPLTGISSFTQMLLEGAAPDDPRTRLLEKIERQTFRAAKIVNALLNLARPAQLEKGPVDLNSVVNDVLSLLEHQLKTANIRVRRDLTAASPIALGLDHNLQQIFMNLFLNARDAMPNGGWLSITTRCANGRAVVEVGDTGSGISREHLSRIYDPFFTTKALGRGTGLGLSITYGIVQDHGGTIECDSVVGQGARFTIEFPLATTALRRQSEASR